jgi:acetyltransferase
LKVHSRKLTHKTDVGGVKLNLNSPEAVREAYSEIQLNVTSRAGADSFEGVTVQPMVRQDGYELIVGSSVDSQFGPVILFGSGGQLVEVYRDRALALPPLNTTLAQRMMEQTKVYQAMKGVRGRKPVNWDSLEGVLVRFSYIPIELPRIKEIDINPLLASSEGLAALDARIVLFDGATPDSALPRPAIRPYPIQYASLWTLRDGQKVLIRPIRPEDEPLMRIFHGLLSDQTVYLRYFHMEGLSARVAHERLIRKCFIDYDREMALVAEGVDPGTHQPQLLGVGRLARQRDSQEGEVAVLVADRFQNLGLGSELLRRLIEIAPREGYARIVAHILPENTNMRKLAERSHFEIKPHDDPTEVLAVLNLARQT